MAWKWTKARENAAFMLAEGIKTDAQIYNEVKICESTLNNWKRIPEFDQRVSELVKEFAEHTRRNKIRIENITTAKLLERFRFEGIAFDATSRKTFRISFSELTQLLKTLSGAKVEVSGPGGGPIEIRSQDDIDRELSIFLAGVEAAREAERVLAATGQSEA